MSTIVDINNQTTSIRERIKMQRKFSSFDLLPNVIQSPINEVLCKNIFDHFINEKEEQYVFGALSNSNDSDKITIADAHLHANQLQPVFQVDGDSYTFQDLIIELDKQGSNINNFKEWGDASFLNFLPPINLDKFNNFQNYVWVDLDTKPQYVCMRSQLIHEQEHMLMVARKMASAPINIISTTTNTITFEGSCSFIFNMNSFVSIQNSSGNDGTYTVDPLLTVVTYNSTTNTHTTTIQTTTPILASTGNGQLVIPDVTATILGSLYNVMRRVYNVTFFDTFAFDEDSALTPDSTDGLYFDQEGAIVSNPEDLYVLNDWQINNKWLHKDDVPTNMYGISATQPIIEYQYELEMNEWFKVTRQWKYRSSAAVNWQATTTNHPSVHEYDLSRSVANYEGLYVNYNSFDISNSLLYVPLSTTIAQYDLINIKGNSNIYEVELITTSGTQKIIKLRAPIGLVTLPNPSTSSVDSSDKRFRHLGKKSTITSCNEVMVHDSDNFCLYTVGDLHERSSWAYDQAGSDITITGMTVNTITISGRYPLVHGNGAAPTVTITLSGDVGNNSTFTVDNDKTVIIQNGTSYTTTFAFPDGSLDTLNPLASPLGKLAFNYIPNDIMQVYDALNGENITLKIKDIELATTTSNAVVTNQSSRPISKVIYDPLYNNPSSRVCGNLISFNFTTYGDKWLGPFVHWVYDGVIDVDYASNRTTRPSYYSHTETFAPNQEASIISTYGVGGQSFAKNQYGVKVFVDGRLQRVGYTEGFYNGTTFNPNPTTGLCNAIKFDSPVSRESGTEIVIDMSVDSYSDYTIFASGYFRTSTEDPNDIKYVSCVAYYKNYQQQNLGNEYPIFNLYNRTNQFVTANELFMYDRDGNTFSRELNEFVYKTSSKEYRFKNLMIESGGTMHYYKNSNITAPVYAMSTTESSSVWRRTVFPAQYVPKIIDREGSTVITLDENSFWEIPPYVKNNPENVTESNVYNSQLYRHFNTIIGHNSQNGFTYRGGKDTIDQFNNALRTYGELRYDVIGNITTSNIVTSLCSNVGLNKINFVNVVEFITKQQKTFISTSVDVILSSIVADLIANTTLTTATSYLTNIKQNFAYDDISIALYGDSLSKQTNGIPNVCHTVAFAGLLNKIRPHVAYDHKRKIIRFQTHIMQQYLDIETECELQSRIITTLRTKLNAYVVEPSIKQVNDLLIQNDILKKWNGSAWIDVIGFNTIREIVGNTLVEGETALYNSCNDPAPNAMPSVTGPQTTDYNNIVKKQFTKYVEDLNISDITVNPIFNQADPFTWNYSSVLASNVVNPLTTSFSSSYIGCDYRFIYERVFKTPYPHLEPWRMQGYYYKPTWWDAEYDGSPARKWTVGMWTNILAGIVPVGQRLAYVTTLSTGAGGEATVYNFVPVNISTGTTTDGYAPDDLLPPYWIAPSADPIDVLVQTYVLIRNSSHIDFNTIANAGEYGRGSYLERNWYDSVNFSNDVRVIARFLTQPLKYISEVFFNPDYLSGDFYSRNGILESVSNSTLYSNDMKYDVSSLYMFYARSKGILGINSNAQTNWKTFSVKYGHVTDKLINSVDVLQVSDNIIEDYEVIDDERLVKRIDFTNFSVSVVQQTRTSSRDSFKSRWKFLVNTHTNRVKSVTIKKTFFAVVTKLNSNNTFNANLTDFTTGMGVTFAADGLISDDLSFQDIFYLIKISNSQGAIARTYNDAMLDVRVSINDRPTGYHYIMVPNANQPLVDLTIPKAQSTTSEITFPTTITGEYSLINFLVGYIEQQHVEGINEANTRIGVIGSLDVDWWSQINLLRDLLQKLNDFSFNGGEYIDAQNLVLSPYETEVRINHGEQFFIDNFVNQNGEYEDDSQLYDVFGRAISSNDILCLRGDDISTIRSMNGRNIGGGSINIMQKRSIIFIPSDYYNFSFGILLSRIDEAQMRLSSKYNYRPGYVVVDGKPSENISTTISSRNKQLREGAYNHHFNNMTDVDNISYNTIENNKLYETSLLTKGTKQFFNSVLGSSVDEIIAFNLDGIIRNDSKNIPLMISVNNAINSKTDIRFSSSLTDADVVIDFTDSRQWKLLPHYGTDHISRWNGTAIFTTIDNKPLFSTNRINDSYKLTEFYAGYDVELTQHNIATAFFEVNTAINSGLSANIAIGKITSHKKQVTVALNDQLVDFSLAYNAAGATVTVSLASDAVSNNIKVMISPTFSLPQTFVSQIGYDDLIIQEPVLTHTLPYLIDVSYDIRGVEFEFENSVVEMSYDTDATAKISKLPSRNELKSTFMFRDIDPSTTNWRQSQVGKMWAKKLYFKNFFNEALYDTKQNQINDINGVDLSNDWGIFRWVESSIPPSQWYDIHEARQLGALTSETENTKNFIGEPYHKMRTRSRVLEGDPWGPWSYFTDVVATMYSNDPIVVVSTTAEPGTLVNIFINGTISSVAVVDGTNNITFDNVVTNGDNKIVIKLASPSFENTELVEYEREFYNTEGLSVQNGVTLVKYYFWVKNHTNDVSDVLKIFENTIRPESNLTYSFLGWSGSSFKEMVVNNATPRQGWLKITTVVDQTWDTVKVSEKNRVPQYLWNVIGRVVVNSTTPYALHDELTGTETRFGLKENQILCDYDELSQVVLDSLAVEDNWGELQYYDIISSINDGTIGQLLVDNYFTIPASTVNAIFFTLLFLALTKTEFEYNVLVTSLVDVDTEIALS